MPFKTDQKDAGTGENYSEDYISGQNRAQSCLKLGDHGIKELHELYVLKKPPLEDYVSGTRKKKHRKRKPKCEKRYSNACNLFFQTNEKFESKDENFERKDENLRDLSLATETFEEKLLNEIADRKVRNNLGWMKLQDEKNYRRQRLLGKQAIEELENLVETWLGYIQRKRELRQKAVEDFSPVSSLSCRSHNYRPIEISRKSKKIWNDRKDEKISGNKSDSIKRKEEEQIRKSSSVPLDFLENDFLEKLVFIDDSDDEQDCV